MQKPSFVKSVEVWTVRPRTSTNAVPVQEVRIAVRAAKGSRDANGKPLGGRFHGATNFKAKQ